MDEYYILRVNETNHNKIIPGKPVIPVKYKVFNLTFGSKIINIDYQISQIKSINLTGNLSKGKAKYDTTRNNNQIVKTQEINNSFPESWFSYHTGGGIIDNKHTTFFVLRISPARYYRQNNQIRYIQNIMLNITYEEPVEPVLDNNNLHDLLIITPSKYKNSINNLASHKEKHGINSKIVTIDEIYKETYWKGRDNQEKIKYFIKKAVENWGVKHVLLIGGIKGQTNIWDLPVRYSRVVPPTEQEYPEQSFISDLYYADLYNGDGSFSSWDSNNDNIFSVWNETFQEKMDLYPDVYLGRLPCRTVIEVKNMVNKIIRYENKKVSNQDWFKNFVLVAGDSYNDTNGFNEGELISEKAKTLMPDFSPVEVYAREDQEINRKTVNKAMNPGAGFAYFCGHGSPMTWNTHYPPDGEDWTKGYEVKDMMFLRNWNKPPVTVVGGCHNGQFDVTMYNILKGIRKEGLSYFSLEKGNLGEFWYGKWSPNCWAWWLNSKKSAGSIACIANTGLGTHGEGDQDDNGVADYLEILDGWLELRFFELYGIEGKDILGANHADTLIGYLHKFLGDNSKMDVKMVQQWELFGDPTLKIGGYK